MRSFIRRSFTLALLALAFVGSGSTARAEFLALLGSTANLTNALVTLDSGSLRADNTLIGITGLTGGATERLLDIDYRPATGQLFALSDASRLYTINTSSGLASLVSTLSTALSGTTSNPQFSIDFNPTVDRLRIISNSGQNLRVNVASGAVTVDTPLTVTGVVGNAYTNSIAGATRTTLYDINYNAADGEFGIAVQTNPNGGIVGPFVTSEVTSPNSLNGFDISGATGAAFIGSNTRTDILGNDTIISTVNLNTGAVSRFGVIGIPDFQVRGLSVQTVPEPASIAMLTISLLGAGFVVRRRLRDR